MTIEAVQYAFNGSLVVTMDGDTFSVPDDMDNRHRQMIAEWEAEGNTIEPYVEPPPPLQGGDLMQDIPVTRAEFDALEARVTALEGP